MASRVSAGPGRSKPPGPRLDQTVGSNRRRPAGRPWRVTRPATPPGSVLDQDVVAGASVEEVLPRPAVQDVVAGAAEERVVPRAAEEGIVAGAAVLREQDRIGRQARSFHDVVAGQRVDGQPVAGRL